MAHDLKRAREIMGERGFILFTPSAVFLAVERQGQIQSGSCRSGHRVHPPP